MISENDKLIYPNPVPLTVWQEVMARAYAQITQLDEAAGRVLDALEQYGFAENTLVIWTTDHGDALACHGGHFDKRSYMPEEMLRVPMAVRYPGRLPAGLVSNALVSNLDVAPTVLDAAGCSFLGQVDGKSLLGAGAGMDNAFRSCFVCETHGHLEEHQGRALLTQRYKYVYNQNQLDELYDLCLDPYEQRNLAVEPDFAPLLAKMRGMLREWATETGDHLISLPPNTDCPAEEPS